MSTIDLQWNDANQKKIHNIDFYSDFSPSMKHMSVIDAIDYALYSSEGSDISLLIMEDENFVQSIKAAKDQMRNGETYLSYEDVFGD